MSKYGDFSGPYLDTFHAVPDYLNLFVLAILLDTSRNSLILITWTEEGKVEGVVYYVLHV